MIVVVTDTLLRLGLYVWLRACVTVVDNVFCKEGEGTVSSTVRDVVAP